ncbi:MULTISPECIES: SGNH/GDSL hydrolase family protein [Planktothrix]|jgi:hypothetical protein|uniref:SGNH/GDSL hydrolase family protein n=1 Tax=Planktothrix TaxID=54304 RepID=UPI00040A0E27|nr:MULTISPECIES: SGNH/GDSL hydrolase family protein [Planktothrix]CAD0233083.1 GDSL-lipase [Planktothrix agardhii]CAD5912430.1 G-D-S-L family lipolytic protein [Planktothrix agardhii]
MTPFKRFVRFALIGVLILGGLFIGVAIPEIGLRIAGIEYKLYRIVDDERGWTYKPGDSGWYRFEGESYVTINREGFLDREHTKVKPDNTFRIALLGDSFVAAREVPPEKAFASILERSLNGCDAMGGKQVEVLKFGIAGYGTDQELITLRQKVGDYDPDLVILAIFTSNDIANNTLVLNNLLYNTHKPGKPYFVFEDGKLVLDRSFLETEEYRAQKSWSYKAYAELKSHSRLLQVMSRLKQTLMQTWAEPRTEALQNLKLMVEDEIYREPTDPRWQEAWQVTEELIRMIDQEVLAKGADFLALTLTNDLQVHPNSALRQKAMEILGAKDLLYPEKRINALGDLEGFSVLNLAPDFQAYAEENQVCLHGHDNAIPCGGHWNAVGHQLAGEKIAQKVCQDFRIEENPALKLTVKSEVY